MGGRFCCRLIPQETPQQPPKNRPTTSPKPSPRYEGPYTGRKELAGCGGGQPAISKLEPLPADAPLSATGWAAEGGAVLEAGGNGAGQLAAGGALPASFGGVAGEAGAVVTRLPLGAWSVVRVDGGGNVVVESGAVGTGGKREVARRSYEGGAVRHVSIGVDGPAA
jgi:hypothetical protein